MYYLFITINKETKKTKCFRTTWKKCFLLFTEIIVPLTKLKILPFKENNRDRILGGYGSHTVTLLMGNCINMSIRGRVFAKNFLNSMIICYCRCVLKPGTWANLSMTQIIRRSEAKSATTVNFHLRIFIRDKQNTGSKQVDIF